MFVIVTKLCSYIIFFSTCSLWIPGALFTFAGFILSSIAYLLVRYYRRRKYRLLFTTSESILGESDQLRILINNLPDSVYIKDSSSRYILCNQRFVKQLKADSPENIYGKTDVEIYKNDAGHKYLEEDGKIMSGELPFLTRKHESAKNGENKITLTTKIPIKNKKGRIIGLMGTCTDITEQEIASRQLEEKNKILEKEENLFRALMDNMPDTIYIKDTECRFLDGNPSQVRVTKAGTHENLLGKTDFDFYPRDIAEIFYKDDKQVLETGKPVINKEEMGFDADGNIRVKSTTKVPFRDKNGKILGLVGIGRDITKQKEAEEKLKEQTQSLQEINVLLEERQEEINQQSDELSLQNKLLEEERNLLRTLLDSIPDYIYLKDANSQFITVNRKLMKSFKTDNLGEIIGKTEKDFYPEDYAVNFLKDDKQIFSTGKAIIDKEEPGIDEAGKFIHLLTSKVPVIDSDGKITGIIGIARDISVIKEAELKLKEQADHLKEANILLEERQEEIQQQSSELSSQNKILENERNLLRTLIDTVPDFIYIKDNESRFIAANKKILQVMKAPSHQYLEGKTDFEFYPKKIAQLFFNDEQQIIKSGKALINKEEIGFDVEGNQRIISTTKVPFYNADGKIAGIVGVGRDITEMKEFEEILKKQASDLQENNRILEERQEEIEKQSESLSEQNKILENERNLLRTLIDNMPDYIYIKDVESRFLTVNSRLLHVMHAKTLDEIIGKTDYDSTPTKEAADLYFQDERRIISSGKPIINKEEIGFDENDRERVISTTKVPFYDADGNIAGIVGIGRDITKQKNAEKQLREQAQNLQEVNIILEERQEKIQQQSEELNSQAQILKKANLQLEQLNATKNKFFSIIAHDLKNPFQAIFGFSELLLRNYIDFDDPQKLELLGMIKTSSESAYNLLENLLQWARTQTERIKYSPTDINLDELIEQNISLSQGSAENKHISLVSQVNCKSPAFADKNMINLVIRNLISNAIKFTNDGGVVTVQCARDDKNKQVLCVSISDTGIGISPDNIKKLFRIDEYFSTSGTAGESGTGLGLIICKEFVEKNKGTINIVSELEVGTTFTFTLPRSETK
jgi:PAS domain S-box-containing protein